MATTHLKYSNVRVTGPITHQEGTGRTRYLVDTRYSDIQVTVTSVGDQEEIHIVNAGTTGYTVNVVGVINGTTYTAAAPLEIDGVGSNVRLLTDSAGNILARSASLGVSP